MLTEDQVKNLAGTNLSTGQVQTLAGVTTPTAPSTITPSSLQPATPIDVPPAPTPTDPTPTVAGGSAAIASNDSSLADYVKQIQGMFTPPASATDQYNKDYAAAGIDEKQQAFNTSKQKFNTLKAQLDSLNAEATAVPIQLQQDAQNGGANVTKAGLQPQQTAALRNIALRTIPVQAAALAAQAEMTGNQDLLQQAQDHLDKVYQIHQTDATNQYNYQTNLLNKALDFANTKEQNAIADKKAELATNHSDLMDVINNAQSLSASAIKSGQADIAAKLTSLTPPDVTSKTFASDLQKYRVQVSALQAQIKDPNAELDTALKQAQLDNIRSEIANRGGTGGIQPDQVLAYAQQYASDGKIPTGLPKGTFGTIAQVAKELPKADGTVVDNNTGIRSDKLTATQLDAYGALRDLTTKIQQAQDLFKNLNTGLIGGTLGNIVPTQERQEYDVLRGEITDLLARARTGAAITAYEESQYKSKIPGTFNQTFFIGNNGETKLSGLRDSIAGKLTAQLKASGASMYGFSKVKLHDGQEYVVGDIIQNASGQKGRVNPDGTITLIN